MATALIFTAWTAGATPQSNVPAFRSGVTLVPVYVSVTDRSGRVVQHLRPEDFDVRIDGHSTPIALFETGVALTAALLLDESPSMPEWATTIDSATAFLSGLRAEDRACVGLFARTVTMPCTFFGETAAAVRALRARERSPTAGTALWDAIDATITALGAAARPVVIVVTDGEDTTSRTDLATLRQRLIDDDVIVYAVGLRGQSGRISPYLAALADESGGVYREQHPRNLVAALHGFVEELRHQYVFAVPTLVRDGKTHSIEVKVRRAGMNVRARRMFVAPRS